MDTNSNQISVAGMERPTNQPIAPTESEHDTQGFGGLLGGVVGSNVGPAGFVFKDFGAVYSTDTQLQGRKPGVGMGSGSRPYSPAG